MGKRYLFYIRGIERNIVITDESDNKEIEYRENEISKILSGSKNVVFRTEKDSLILRPHEVCGVIIQELDPNAKRSNKKQSDAPPVEHVLTPEVGEVDELISALDEDVVTNTEEALDIEEQSLDIPVSLPQQDNGNETSERKIMEQKMIDLEKEQAVDERIQEIIQEKKEREKEDGDT